MLIIEQLRCKIGDFSLRGISLTVGVGSYTVLLGPTGSGKSTLIKSILGLHPLQGGRVSLNGRDITRTPPELRRIGYLPQHYALFPHLTVEGNIRFGLDMRGAARRQSDIAVAELCRTLAIEDIRERGVVNLSGGEQQRVALARALAAKPELILLDEPFSAIDEGARRGLWSDLQETIRALGITAVHITHNLDEAYTLGERIAVMIDGSLAQQGSRQEIFERPATERVARYLNYRNIFTGVASPVPEGARVDCGHFSITVGKPIPQGSRVTLCIRQQDLKIVREGFPLRHSLSQNVYAGEIVSLLSLPESCVMHFRMEGSPRRHDLELKFPAHIRERHNLAVGKRVRVAAWMPSIIVF
ncbi:MAG: ABC transporter ATP-binding protein [Candidatus Aureabacteria bacterium]|nr:ABC transporter ATP-binding protein [Candidatus Auribacterota bacterium]